MEALKHRVKNTESESSDSDPSFINWGTLSRILSLSEPSLFGLLICLSHPCEGWENKMYGTQCLIYQIHTDMYVCMYVYVYVCIYKLSSYIWFIYVKWNLYKTTDHNEQFQILMKMRGKVQEAQGAEFQGKELCPCLGVACASVYPIATEGFQGGTRPMFVEDWGLPKLQMHVCVCVYTYPCICIYSHIYMRWGKGGRNTPWAQCLDSLGQGPSTWLPGASVSWHLQPLAPLQGS